MHDRAQDSGTVQAVGAATALLLENQRLDDGARSRLVALALNLRLARMGVSDGTDTGAMLDSSIDELRESLTELRDLARGIHPVVLSERGLEPALRALAARATVPVQVVGQAAGRLPAAVETAA